MGMKFGRLGLLIYCSRTVRKRTEVSCEFCISSSAKGLGRSRVPGAVVLTRSRMREVELGVFVGVPY